MNFKTNMQIQSINIPSFLTNKFYDAKRVDNKRFSPAFCSDVFVRRTKGNTQAASQNTFSLPEQINYENATNIKEAKKFALENFSIKNFLIDNLQIANYVNKGLAKAVNKTHGNIALFENIVEYNKPSSWIQCTNGKNLFINSKVLPVEYFDDWDYGLSQKDREMYSKADFLQRIKFINEIMAKQGVIEQSEFHQLYHELGHLNHEKQNNKKFQYYKKAGTGTSYTSEYEQNGQLNDIMVKHVTLCNDKLKAKQLLISPYALMFPNEFVAEVYAYLLSDKQIPKEFMAIYKKYGGPVV